MDLKILLKENGRSSKVFTDLDDLYSWYELEVESIKEFKDDICIGFDIEIIHDDKTFKFHWNLISNLKTTYNLKLLMSLYFNIYAYDCYCNMYHNMIDQYNIEHESKDI